MTAADLAFIDSTGYHYADFPTFLAYIQSGYQSIYGADTYLGADSMDGQFTSFIAQAIYDTASLGAQTYNAFSPATAQGVGLSMNVQINGIQRQIPSNSTVTLTIVGQAGTVITNGKAQDVNGNIWVLPTTVTIPGGGSINVTATAENAGDITAAASSINVIFTPTQGWQTVNNAAAAVVGTAVETDAALRQRQQVSVADPSLTVIDGTKGAVANVPGVDAVEVYENFEDTPDSNGLPGHSICVVCDGGNFTDIATEIMLHKTPGTKPFAPAGAGFRQIQVFDPGGMPINIQFYNPPDTATANVIVTMDIDPLNGWDTNSIPLIQAAVAAYVNGVGIGKIVYPSAMYPLILGVAPGTFQINDLQIKFFGGSFGTVPITPPFKAIPNTNPSTDVTVNVL